MSRFSQLFASLTGSAAVAAIAAPAAGADAFADLEISAEDKAKLTADLTAALTEVSAGEQAKGFKAGNDRAVAVLGSDKGKAHAGIALSLLGNAKMASLTADEILAALPDAAAATTTTTTTAPDAAAAAAAAAAAGGGDPPAGSKEHQERLAAAPKVALGNRGATAHEVEGAGDRGKGADKATVLAAWGQAQGVAEDGSKNGARVSVRPVR